MAGLVFLNHLQT